ncbi:MAG: hypothetical protein GEU99_12155 [Luteitalea sp.]|nr:hypothetical protein [Luteitalea sp.]
MRVVSLLVCALLLTPHLASASRSSEALPQKQAAATAVVVIVTDKSGNRLPGVQVTVTGPVPREGVTSDEGQARFTALRPGSYKFRFEADGFIPFERDVVLRGGRVNEVRAGLAAKPALPEKPQPEARESPPPSPPEPPAEPTSLVVEAFLEKNRIDGDGPNQETEIGCTAGSKVVLHQLHDLLENQLQKDADAVVNVVEGEGVLRLGEAHHPLVPSMVVVIPRGISYSMKREGRRPLVVLVTLAGAPCSK